MSLVCYFLLYFIKKVVLNTILSLFIIDSEQQTNINYIHLLFIE